jgi:hypothetical protein
MKTYAGYRRLDTRGNPVQALVAVHEDGKEPRPLHLRHDLRRHSAEFNWGYPGSGPAQLALALAADVLGDDEQAQDVYQRLKFLCGVLHKNFYADFPVMRTLPNRTAESPAFLRLFAQSCLLQSS